MSARFVRAAGTLSRRVGGEVMLASRSRDGVDLLGTTAAAAWELLDTPRSGDELLGELARAFAADPRAIASEVEGLVADLLERGWIEEIAGE